ncbi:MAG: Gfo/Idh/MocA family oxidoreductase [Spirochaetaceae bacterium]|nr:Gfo/Idh/MocA family oxidoreductase [Spirochaetaceae bacterium]
MAAHRVVALGGNRTHLESYAREFADDPRCELVAVADEPGLPGYREALNRLLADELGVPYLPLPEALELPGVDVVVSCVDVERRARVAQAVLAAGKHVFLDKPLAASVEDARSIADAADAAGVVTQMLTTVHTPWAQEAKETVRSGALGRIGAVHSDMLMAKGRPGTVPAATVRSERGSDGTFTHVAAKRELFDMGVYPVALIHWLTGRRVTSVCGVTGNYFFAEHAELRIEDYGGLLLTLDDGSIATACCGRIGMPCHPQVGERRVTVVGEEGLATFAGSDPHIEIYNTEPVLTTAPVHPYDPMQMWASTMLETQPPAKNRWIALAREERSDIAAFLDCLDSGVRPEVTARDALHHVEVLMAGYESAASGRPVRI